MVNSSIVSYVTLFVLAVIFLVQFDKSYGDMTYVKCKENYIEYRVRNLPDKEKAAELLGKTHERLKKACQILIKRHPNDERVIRLNRRFPKTTLAEADSSGNHTSYSINKGEKIVLCLRAKDGSNRLVDENLLLFVALHELSHIMTKSVGHKPEFWNNFKFVLENCQEEGLYKCIDFTKNPMPYCGITVTNSPASCKA
jgi:predicted metal-dependent hydrolase